MERRVLILGSTGSIGRSALEVVTSLNGQVRLAGLTAANDWRRLAEQATRHAVPCVAIANERHYDELRRSVPAGTKVLAGREGLVEAVEASGASFVLSAIVGAAGLPATLAAVERGLDVGLANKESLVVAGSLIMPLAARTGSRLIPVDSEHSAIFQAMVSGHPNEVHKIYLTASGGPFRTWPRERMQRATLEEALHHPTWSMGPKITIDSATMMNKALEVVEATHLFGLPPERIEVLVHPESIIHSMVEFNDASVIAQLGAPDMRTPIQYAITYPRRIPGPSTRLTWTQARSLNFEPPDPERFPALRLGFAAAARGGTAGAALNAANEAAVERFRRGEIRFGRIAELTERVLGAHPWHERPTLAQLAECDAWARHEVTACRPD